jgi:hypothetical protein
MRANQQLLQQAVNEGLLSLGEPIMKTIKWHLAANGVFLDSKDQVDVRVLYGHLEQIVGNIADVVMNEIYSNLSQRNTLSVEGIKQSESVVSRIERFLNAEGREGDEIK